MARTKQSLSLGDGSMRSNDLSFYGSASNLLGSHHSTRNTVDEIHLAIKYIHRKCVDDASVILDILGLTQKEAA